MNLRQQIVSSNIDAVNSLLGTDQDVGFVRFAHSLVTDQSIHSFDPSDLVDGGQDKQIDVITIVDETDEAYLYILQVKNTKSFSSNTLIQMRNGLGWIFNKSRADIDTLANSNFKDQILAYRALQSSIGPSNIHIRVAYVTNSPDTTVSEECSQEEKSITDEYDNDVFASFNFNYWSANEIVDRINALDKKNKKISSNLKIRYDANAPSLIKYQTQGLTGIVCSVPANEIARVVNDDDSGFVFDQNIRKYLGNRGSVNPGILSTCSTAETSFLFWFLNNGITIVCDKADPVTDPDDPHVKLTNLQIVNGCQTASTLARAATQGLLKRDTRVLVRIYETGDNALVDQIVLTTNNQNKISGRNLRSNDPIQSDLEKGFALYDLHYERKPRQYDNVPEATKDNVISNDIVATAYLGIVLKRCSDARSRKYKVWSDFYDKIFCGGAVEPYVVSSLVYSNVRTLLQGAEYGNHDDYFRRYMGKNASFHVARIVTHRWRGVDSWNDIHELSLQIDQLYNGNVDFDTLTKNAFTTLLSLVDKNQDLNSLLKSSALDDSISKELHNSDCA